MLTSTYESEDDQNDAEGRFRIEFFSVTLDLATISPESSFQLMSSFMNIFGFLCDVKLGTLSHDDLIANVPGSGGS